MLLQKNPEMLCGKDNKKFSHKKLQNEHEHSGERDNRVDIVACQLVHSQSLRGLLSSWRDNSHIRIVYFFKLDNSLIHNKQFKYIFF